MARLLVDDELWTVFEPVLPRHCRRDLLVAFGCQGRSLRKLTNEPVSEPPARMRKWFEGRPHAGDRLWILDVGETCQLV